MAPGALLLSVLQLPSTESAPVTTTPYKSLERLAPIMDLVSPSAFSDLCRRVGLAQIKTERVPLQKGKAFYTAIYRKNAEPV